MKNPKIRLLSVCLLLLGSFACAPSPGYFGYDNPQIRKIQREQAAVVIPSESEQRSLAKKCDRKVSFITTGTSAKDYSSGRAVAISKDGYFLTAYHVVNKGEFFLDDNELTSEQLKKLNQNGYFLERDKPENRLPGRIVWFDKGADLAVIKFERKTPHHFSQLKFPAPVDGVVYSSDDQGHIILPEGQTTEKLEENAVGNGPYFSAGTVLFSQLFTHGPGVHTIGSTLVARGGMSGGALVTRSGELCGIISQVGLSYQEHNNELKLTVHSTSRMLPPKVLNNIVRQDRARN